MCVLINFTRTMHTCKILFLLAVAFLCINARVLKRQKKLRKCANAANRNPFPLIDLPCKSILDPTYGGLGTCTCQSIFFDECDYGCGCKYVDNYGVLNPELSNYGRVPAIKLPKAIPNFDGGIPMPAINLPRLYDLVVDFPGCQTMPPFMELPGCPPMPPFMELPGCQPMPPFMELPGYQTKSPFMDFPCAGQFPSYQIVDPCRQMPIVEFLPEIPSPMLKVPYAEPYYLPNSPQVIQLPACGCPMSSCGCPMSSCGCPMSPCNCPMSPSSCVMPPCSCPMPPCSCPMSSCGCQMPRECGCQNMKLPCGCQSTPCGYGCQNVPCGYQNQPCGCDNGYKISYGSPCGCPSPLICGCQNIIQLPAIDPCPCQLSPVELPVYSYGCPPPDMCCGGKYLRQVTLQPPFL